MSRTEACLAVALVLGVATPVPAQERAAEKWLATGDDRRVSASVDVATRLEAWGGRLRPLVCWYEGARLIDSHACTGGELQARGGAWTCEVRAEPVEEEPEALDLAITFRLVEGEARAAGAAVAFDLEEWATDSYVMIPAAVYDGNRCVLVDRGYAQGLDRKFLYEREIPEMSVPIPQLSPEVGTCSRLELSTCNAATPAFCLLDRHAGRAVILLAEQRTGSRDNGLVIEESADRSRATLVVTAPGVRERKPLFVGFAESPDRGIDWAVGDEAHLRLRLYSFAASRIPELLERFGAVRKALTGPNRPRDLVPLSRTLEWMTQRIDERWHEGPEYQFYCPENAAWISFGWVGGLMNTFPMLALGDELHLERVARTFDFAIPRAQGTSGYFHGALNHDGECFGREGYPELPEVVLTRKNADVLFWMIKQFLLLEAQGRGDAIDPEWKANVRRLADAFVATWESHGEWGRMLNNHTGAVAEFGTSGGVMAVGGLALAGQYYGHEEYLDVARAAAELTFERDVLGRGRTTGGCADILHNADSETAFGFLTALMALYEVTGEEAWLEKCETLAHLAATWVVSYDYELPPDTELARGGARLAGTVWASTQNKHGAPGICASSGDPLFKLYRATGDLRHAELLRDIVHAHGESLRPGGYTNERLTFCDAEPHSVGNRGNHVTGWCELNGALMALELPGVYLRTDSDRLFVFDHVQARVLERKGGEVHLELTNTTPHDAEVTILAESGVQAARPLGYTAFLGWPSFAVGAGETAEVRVRAGE